MRATGSGRRDRQRDDGFRQTEPKGNLVHFGVEEGVHSSGAGGKVRLRRESSLRGPFESLHAESVASTIGKDHLQGRVLFGPVCLEGKRHE